MRLAGNTGRKNDAKNRHLSTTAQLCRAESLQLRHVKCNDNRKKLLTQQYLLHKFLQYGELREIGSLVWARHQISTRFAS